MDRYSGWMDKWMDAVERWVNV